MVVEKNTSADSRTVMKQLYPAIAASLVFLSVGAQLAWASVALPKYLTGEESPRLTQTEMWWAFGLLYLGQAVGAVLAMPLCQCCGRRLLLLSTAPPSLAAWLLCALARTAAGLLAARALSGVASGVALAVAPLYIAETSLHPRLRGIAVSLPQLATNLGMLLTWVITPDLSLLSYISSGFPLLFFVVFAWVPESPYYLLLRGRHDAARAALRTLTNSPDAAETALLELNDDAGNENPSSTGTTVLQLFIHPVYRKALFVVLAAVTFDSFISAGIYLPHPDDFATDDAVDIETGGSLVGLVQVVGAMAAPFLLEFLGRRWAALASSAASVAAMVAGAGLLLAAEEASTEATGAAWALALAGAAARALCLGALPVTTVVEVPMARVKEVVAAGAAAAAPLLWCAAAQFRQVLREKGEYYSFVLAAIFSALAAWYSATVLPESRGLTLRQVQEQLQLKVEKETRDVSRNGNPVASEGTGGTVMSGDRHIDAGDNEGATRQGTAQVQDGNGASDGDTQPSRRDGDIQIGFGVKDIAEVAENDTE